MYYRESSPSRAPSEIGFLPVVDELALSRLAPSSAASVSSAMSLTERNDSLLDEDPLLADRLAPIPRAHPPAKEEREDLRELLAELGWAQLGMLPPRVRLRETVWKRRGTTKAERSRVCWSLVVDVYKIEKHDKGESPRERGGGKEGRSSIDFDWRIRKLLAPGMCTENESNVCVCARLYTLGGESVVTCCFGVPEGERSALEENLLFAAKAADECLLIEGLNPTGVPGADPGVLLVAEITPDGRLWPGAVRTLSERRLWAKAAETRRKLAFSGEEEPEDMALPGLCSTDKGGTALARRCIT